MPDIVFRAKVETIHNMDDTVAFRHVKVPNLARRHCDMAAFRADHRYSSYANSDLFPAMLGRAVKALGVGEHIRMDAIPSGVSVDTSGFLARVTITI
ncbi:MAG TPA: hypothetical protein VIR45_13925 [Kiloniellaceae bacterium]